MSLRMYNIFGKKYFLMQIFYITSVTGAQQKFVSIKKMTDTG